MGKKNKGESKAVVAKKEYERKCDHGILVGDPCDKCEQEKTSLNKKISTEMEVIKASMLKMKQDGWCAFFVPGTSIIRFSHYNNKDSWYCAITAVCKFLLNKSFGPMNFPKASRLLNIDLASKPINDAVDIGDDFQVDENSKKLRAFILDRFGLKEETVVNV